MDQLAVFAIVAGAALYLLQRGRRGGSGSCGGCGGCEAHPAAPPGQTSDLVQIEPAPPTRHP